MKTVTDMFENTSHQPIQTDNPDIRRQGTDEFDGASCAVHEEGSSKSSIISDDTTSVIGTEVHDIDTESSVIELDVPEVGAPSPVVELDVPEVDASSPVVELDVPEVDASSPVVELDVPEVDAPSPVVELDVPDEVAESSVIELDVPEVGAPSPVVELDVPEVDAPSPVVELDVPDEVAKSSDVELEVQDGEVAPAEVLVKMSGAEVNNDGNVILSGVDITIHKGEFVYLLGKVGSGKSSIIKTLIAELPLKKGEAEVAGYNLRKIKRRHIPFLRRKLGVIFQDFQLLMDRSVQDNLLFVLEATGWRKRSQMLERAAQVLDMVGLGDKAGKMPHQLSGGEQQRVAIARAFLNNPQVILADEPTGNLDEDTATDIMNLFMHIHAEQQPAVLMVTHNRELYKRYPGRVLICEGGSVREMEQEIEFNPVLE